MATLDDKLLGEKLHDYCSSSEDENDDDDDESKAGKVRATFLQLSVIYFPQIDTTTMLLKLHINNSFAM
jgi:hypothetical protein